MGSRLLTASRLREARRCPRLHQLKYVQGYRAKKTAHALRFGTLVHKGLEAWWEARRINMEIAALDLAMNAMGGEADPFDLVRAQELMRGYHLRWIDEPLEVLAVEAQFETDLIHPTTHEAHPFWRLSGKLDAVVRDSNGLVRTMEHKTSGDDISPGAPYWAKLRLNSQISIYDTGAKSLGHDIVGCVYDVLGKPKLKPYQVNSKRAKAETPEEFRLRLREDIASEPSAYFQRAEVVRLESEIEAAALDTWAWAERLLIMDRMGNAPRNDAACFDWGRACDFFSVCCSETSLDSDDYTQDDNVHPELSVEVDHASQR